MPVLRKEPTVWLPLHSIKMGENYLYCGPGERPRAVKITGYAKKGCEVKYHCNDVLADGTVVVGDPSRCTWVTPWFKPLGIGPIDVQRYTKVKLKLRFTEG